MLRAGRAVQLLAGVLFVAGLRSLINSKVMAAENNPAVVPVARDELWWMLRHRLKAAEAKNGGVGLLFVGDSITQNYEKSGPAPNEVFLPTWNRIFAALAMPAKAMNLGFSGDLTQHVLWRLQHGEVAGLAPRDVVLLIGTNNTAQNETPEQITAGVIAVAEELHARLGAARISIIEILPSDISTIKSAADAAVNASVRHHYAGSTYIRTLDLSGVFVSDKHLDPTLFYDPYLNPPGKPLHPNTIGQRKMAEAVAEALRH